MTKPENTLQFLEQKAEFLSQYLPGSLAFRISGAYGKKAIHLIDEDSETHSVYKELTGHSLTIPEAVRLLEFYESIAFSAYIDKEI